MDLKPNPNGSLHIKLVDDEEVHMLREAVFERIRNRINASQQASPRMWGLLHQLCEYDDEEPLEIQSAPSEIIVVMKEFGDATPTALQEIAAATPSDPFTLSERKKLGDKAVDYSRQIDALNTTRQAFNEIAATILFEITDGVEPALGDNPTTED